MQSMTGQKASAGQILPAGRSLPTPGQKVFYLAIFDLNICNSEGIDICAGHLIREYIGYFLCLTKTINVFSKCNAENACICIFIFAGVVLLTVADPIKLFFFANKEFLHFSLLSQAILSTYIFSMCNKTVKLNRENQKTKIKKVYRIGSWGFNSITLVML